MSTPTTQQTSKQQQMKKKRILVYGGAFTPPSLSHRENALRLSRLANVSKVIIVPCGPRPDKELVSDVEPQFRASMVDMAFQFENEDEMGKIEVDLFDLESDVFTATHDLHARYTNINESSESEEFEVWHVVDGQKVVGGEAEESIIQTKWKYGKELWKTLRFVVLDGQADDEADEDKPPILKPSDLPPFVEVCKVPSSKTARSIRNMVFHRATDWDKYLLPAVSRYISRYGIYHGRSLKNAKLGMLDCPIRPLIRVDDRNPKAALVAANFMKERGISDFECKDPNMYIIFGGDGFMLHCIRKDWRRRLPFIGVNCGHLGFLLNENMPKVRIDCEKGALGESYDQVYENPSIVHCPLLKIDAQTRDGTVISNLAFNDAWLERSTGQTAWIRVDVNGVTRMERLVCDGALVCTAAGSTCYARAMGCSPVPLNAGALILVGSNVLAPSMFQPAVLPIDAEITLATCDSTKSKRPLRGFIDGNPIGEVVSMQCRVSRYATVELVFCEEMDLSEKLARIQFP